MSSNELVEQIMAQVIARVATPEQQALPDTPHPTGETAMAEKSCSLTEFVGTAIGDTLGLVMLEALACGTPVAAFPVAGPLDVLQAGVTGMMDEDLAQACRAALQLDRATCAEQAARQSWRASALEFLASQALLDGEPLAQEDWLPAQA